MTKIGVIGVNGRIGRVIADHILNCSDIKLAAGCVRSSNPLVGQDLGYYLKGLKNDIPIVGDTRDVFKVVDVAIDFTKPGALEATLNGGLESQKPIVIGTTGLSDADRDKMAKASLKIPILYGANMSLGANLLALLAEKSAHLLDDSYDVDVAEIHQRGKVDSPSGTAKAIAKGIAKARGYDEETCYLENLEGVRPSQAVTFTSTRGGRTICDHDVRFMGDDEMITISHRVLSLTVFAKGAVKAALWLKDKRPGLYCVRDMLGI